MASATYFCNRCQTTFIKTFTIGTPPSTIIHRCENGGFGLANIVV